MSRKTEQARETTLDVDLRAVRWRHLFWGAVGLAIGLLMIVRMGHVGWVLGGAVALAGASSVRQFVRTLLHPPGTIAVHDEELALPKRLCSGHTITMPLSDLRHAYLLRRALPFNHTGPVLVVETRRGVFQYPRDWFSTDEDQRRLSLALNRRLGRVA